FLVAEVVEGADEAEVLAVRHRALHLERPLGRAPGLEVRGPGLAALRLAEPALLREEAALLADLQLERHRDTLDPALRAALALAEGGRAAQHQALALALGSLLDVR